MATPDAKKPSEQRTEVALSILYYGLCSSVMLVVNKVTISYIPLPATIFFVQFLVTTAFCFVCKVLGLLEVDALEWRKSQNFMLYVCAFVLSIYFNGRVLQRCNIETLITFRSCCPLFVSVLDWLFLERELPSRRSMLALVGVLAGAVGYVLCDSEFRMHGLGAYGWVSAYLVVIVFEMTYAKHTISNVDFKSPVWGSVYYTNALALAPIGLLAITSGELWRLDKVQVDSRGIMGLSVCSCLGVCMNWSGWNCRSHISAAAYTLLGVACKVISVLLNVGIWDKHASPGGICWLLVALVSSSLYKQAPLRATVGPPPARTYLACQTSNNHRDGRAR